MKEKKSTLVKSCKERSRKKTEVYAISEGMAEDAKVDDGFRTRIKTGLKQLRKARGEERAAEELQVEMQEHVEKGAGASAALGREFVDGAR